MTITIQITQADIDQAYSELDRVSAYQVAIGRSPLEVALARLGLATRQRSGNWVEFFKDGQSLGCVLRNEAYYRASRQWELSGEKPETITLRDNGKD